MSTYRSARVIVVELFARVAKKYYLKGGDFFKPLVIPLQICFVNKVSD